MQSRGGDIVEIRPGDIIYTPADEWHWHGAAPGHFMIPPDPWPKPPRRPATGSGVGRARHRRRIRQPLSLHHTPPSPERVRFGVAVRYPGRTSDGIRTDTTAKMTRPRRIKITTGACGFSSSGAPRPCPLIGYHPIASQVCGADRPGTASARSRGIALLRWRRRLVARKWTCPNRTGMRCAVTRPSRHRRGDRVR